MSKQAIPGPESTAGREFVHSRLIDAPRERVFRAFAEPEHLAKWWGPNGFTSTFHAFEFRPGGHWRFALHGPNGTDHPNESVFVAVVPTERVVFKHVSRPQFEMTISFAEHEGTTQVGWRQLFNSAFERDQIAKFALEANEQNLDRLEALLAQGD